MSDAKKEEAGLRAPRSPRLSLIIQNKLSPFIKRRSKSDKEIIEGPKKQKEVPKVPISEESEESSTSLESGSDTSRSNSSPDEHPCRTKEKKSREEKQDGVQRKKRKHKRTHKREKGKGRVGEKVIDEEKIRTESGRKNSATRSLVAQRRRSATLGKISAKVRRLSWDVPFLSKSAGKLQGQWRQSAICWRVMVCLVFFFVFDFSNLDLGCKHKQYVFIVG